MKSHLKSLASGMLALSCSTGTPCPTNPTPKCEEHTASVPSTAPAVQSEYERLKAEDDTLGEELLSFKEKDSHIAKACIAANEECMTRATWHFQKLIRGKIEKACRPKASDIEHYYACLIKELESAGMQDKLSEVFRAGNPCTRVIVDCIKSFHTLKEDPRIAGLTLDDTPISDHGENGIILSEDNSPPEEMYLQLLPMPIRSYIDGYLCHSDHPAIKPCLEKKEVIISDFAAAHEQEIAACRKNPPKEYRGVGWDLKHTCKDYIVLGKYPEQKKVYYAQRNLCNAAIAECRKRVIRILRQD